MHCNWSLGALKMEALCRRTGRTPTGTALVLRRVRVRRHQPVIARMHVAVEEAVAVQQTVPEILPGVEHRHCHHELPRVDDDRRSRAGAGGGPATISPYLRWFQTDRNRTTRDSRFLQISY